MPSKMMNISPNNTEIVESFYNSGEIESKQWWINGKLHREEGPAFIEYSKSGEIEYVAWWLNGKRHRTDGPAMLKYYESGEIQHEEWYLNDELHREDGPAGIEYYDSNTKDIYKEYYFLNGKNFSQEEWQWIIENNYKWPLNKQQHIEFLLVFG